MTTLAIPPKSFPRAACPLDIHGNNLYPRACHEKIEIARAIISAAAFDDDGRLNKAGRGYHASVGPLDRLIEDPALRVVIQYGYD